MSVGYVKQLAVDLLISSFRAERIGYFDNPNFLPYVGNNAYAPSPPSDLSLPHEAFDSSSNRLTLVQQRSPVVKKAPHERYMLASKMISEGRGSELMPKKANSGVPMTACRSYFPWLADEYVLEYVDKKALVERLCRVMDGAEKLKLNGETMPYPTEFRKLSRQ